MPKNSSPEGFDQEGDSLDKILGKSLFGGTNNPFHPDYEGDYLEFGEESRILSETQLSVWDLLVPEDERAKIGRLDPVIRDKCPYLTKPKDSETEFFYFCNAFDRPKVEDKRVRANLMESHCLGDYTQCSRYKASIKDVK